MLIRGLRRIKGSALSQKIIVLFIFIVFPLYALGLYFIQNAMMELEQRKYDSMSSQITFFLSSLESEIDRINSLQRQYLNDEDLQKISNQFPIMNDYEKIRSYKALYSRLLTLENSSRYVKKVSIYFPETNRILYAGTIQDLQSSLETQQTEANYANACKPSISVVRGIQQHLSMCMTYPLGLAAGESPTFYFNIELSEENISEALNEINDLGGAILISPEWSLTSKGDEDLFRKIIEKTNSTDNHFSTMEIDYDEVSYIVSSKLSAQLDARLMLLAPQNIIFGSLKHYQLWFWTLSFLSVVIIITFSYFVYKLIHQPLRQLLKQFRKVEDGNLDIPYLFDMRDEFSYLNRGFQSMIENLRQLIDETYVQKIKLQKSELKQLQAQINPHFLYNSFYILRNAIRVGDEDTAEHLAQHLGDYFQYVTRNDLDEVPLKFEYDHALSYVAIQDIRFSNRIETIFQPIPMEVEQLYVPRLLLQPLIENAYKYGFNEMLSDGKLNITWQISSAVVIISVADNGKGLDEDGLDRLRNYLNQDKLEADISGLANVHHRLKLQFGDRGYLTVHSEEGSGFSAQIHIPRGESEERMIKVV